MRISRTWVFILVVGLFAATSSIKAQEAADLYKSKCQTCHAADGKGNTPVGQKLGVRDFKAPEVVKESDAEMIDITKKGKNKMPGYDGKLTDDQIKALVKYIRSLK